jgi:selenocysteine-specific elongation factor
VFAEPVAVTDGQHILLLRHGGSTIIGGCVVIWAGASTREQRQALVAAARTLPAELGTAQLATLRLALRGWAPRADIARYRPEGLVELGEWVILPDLHRKLEKEILAKASKPGGVPLKELQAQAGVPSGLVDRICEGIVAAGKFVLRQGILRQAEADQLSLSPLAKRLLAEIRSSGLAGVELSKTPVPGAQSELRALAKSGLAVSLDGDIFLEPSVYAGLVARFLDGLAAGTRQSLAEAKLRTGLSRKYLIPLLNKLELDGYVKRSGDDRVVSGKVFERPAGNG